MNFDWNELAFGSKKEVDTLNAIFVAAPRAMSPARVKQLIKTYLPQGNIVLGLAKEDYVAGLEDQPQFRMLQAKDVASTINKTNAAGLKHSITTLHYFQRDLPFILEKLDFKKVLFVNGSWKYLFHTLPPYYVLATKRISYIMVSPFASEEDAREYENQIMPPLVEPKGAFTAKKMLELADEIAKRSFDNGFQTGVTLGRKKGDTYQFVAQGFNKVVPYQAYAMHHGASREQNFSPMHDLNYYDTIHAEVNLLLNIVRQKNDILGTTLFINLLPCPSCARMLSQTGITEFVYREDHSNGYAVKMLELAGKKVTRIVR